MYNEIFYSEDNREGIERERWREKEKNRGRRQLINNIRVGDAYRGYIRVGRGLGVLEKSGLPEHKQNYPQR